MKFYKYLSLHFQTKMKAFLVKLFEFCLKIINESFIKHVNWNFYILGKFGASSPERERKLLSLAESGPSTRKTTKVPLIFMVI